MGWVKDVLDAIKGDTSANRKLIIDGFKELMVEHKNEARIRREENAALMIELQKFREGEAECQRVVIKLSQEVRDLKEELIFLRKMKP